MGTVQGRQVCWGCRWACTSTGMGVCVGECACTHMQDSGDRERRKKATKEDYGVQAEGFLFVKPASVLDATQPQGVPKVMSNSDDLVGIDGGDSSGEGVQPARACTLVYRRKRPPTPILGTLGPGPGLQIDFNLTEELSKSCES